MPPTDPAEIERRLDAGEWLPPTDVAALLGAPRSTIQRWIKAGRFRYRRRGKLLFLSPEDVRRELDEFRCERRAADPRDGSAPPAEGGAG